jgi:hypothetical protein
VMTGVPPPFTPSTPCRCIRSRSPRRRQLMRPAMTHFPLNMHERVHSKAAGMRNRRLCLSAPNNVHRSHRRGCRTGKRREAMRFVPQILVGKGDVRSSRAIITPRGSSDLDPSQSSLFIVLVSGEIADVRQATGRPRADDSHRPLRMNSASMNVRFWG